MKCSGTSTSSVTDPGTAYSLRSTAPTCARSTTTAPGWNATTTRLSPVRVSRRSHCAPTYAGSHTQSHASPSRRSDRCSTPRPEQSFAAEHRE